MLQVPAELLGLSAEPVLLARNGRAVYANDAAVQLFGTDCAGKPLRALLNAELAELQASSCIVETEIRGRRCIVRMQNAEGLRLFLFHAAEYAPQEINEAFRYAFRSSLMELNVNCSLLQDRAETLGSEALLGASASLWRDYYHFSRMIANLSIVQDAAAEKLFFRPVALDLCSFLRELADSVSVLVPAPELRLRLPESFTVNADPALLETLVMNLLSNALLHARGCTRIVLSLHETRDQAVLSVDDDGCGISPGGLRTVFDRYRHGFDLSGMANGAGLGLTAVREIARVHGGTLLLESREGSGTAVRVSLSRKLSPLVSVQDAGPAWERSYNSILTGLADCLPLSAFSGIYQ